MENMSFQRSKSIITPMRLYWDVNNDLKLSITNAYRFAIKVSETFFVVLCMCSRILVLIFNYINEME